MYLYICVCIYVENIFTKQYLPLLYKMISSNILYTILFYFIL